MKIQELLILLPCYSFEDFPQYLEGEAAEGVLACWTALWHPALVSAAERMPAWRRADVAPDDFAGRLIVVPSISDDTLAGGMAEQAEKGGAHLIQGLRGRQQIVSLGLSLLDDPREADEDLIADFFALGYCYLQIELLTRHMRYSSNLDVEYFGKQVVAAARAATSGQSDLAREHLSKCFDALAEERDHYYPVDAYLIDLSLAAASTIGQGLRRELSQSAAVNLLLPASVLPPMAVDEPASLETLKEAIDQGRCCLLGGPAAELPSPLLSCETVLDQLRLGLQCYQQYLGSTPTVFGRRRFGLTPVLPQIIEKLGFHGALHTTFDDGRFPESGQSRTRWEGVDGSAVAVLARVPLDATRPETFLNLASRISESMESDYVATIGLVHWCGQSSPWLDDLRRCARYTAALGKPTVLSDFFEQSDHTGHLDRFDADQYRSPFLRQAIAKQQADPISRIVRYWNRHLLAESCRAFSAWAKTLASINVDDGTALMARIDECVDSEKGQPRSETEGAALDKGLAETVEASALAVTRGLAPRDGAGAERYAILNPLSFARRVGVELDAAIGPSENSEPLFASGISGEKSYLVLDLPPAGYAWIEAGGEPGGAKPNRKEKPLVEDGLLRNEFFEARIDPATGALRSVHAYQSRGNRLSQQLAYRGLSTPPANTPDGDDESHYSVMVCESTVISGCCESMGEITTQGRLVDREGRGLATFQQRFRVWRGSRVLRLDIRLEPHQQPDANPWNSYYACRFAWPDERSEIWRSVNLTRQPTRVNRFEAPLFVDIEDNSTRTTVFTMGLPYHRRVGLRKLDSLLVVRGETSQRFSLGIGIDVKQPISESLSLLAPPAVVRRSAALPRDRSGWLFHVGSKSVIATAWEPLAEADESSASGGCPGFRVRLLETAGRRGRVTVSAFRPLLSAREVDFRGQHLADCQIVDGKFQLDVSAYQWSQIEARWSDAGA